MQQNLSVQKKYTKNDPHISTMENLLSKGQLTDSDRIFLSFALAKAYDDIGNQKNYLKLSMRLTLYVKNN